MQTPAIVVAGVSSGVGKTTVALGLMRALRDTGLTVQPFKVGPDFLDPMQHQAACGVPSVNLDGWMLGRAACLQSYAAACAASGADIAVVEGVMGLHDGLDGVSDVGSTAEVAKWLGCPVVLVLDAWCLSRSAAAMVLGYCSFDPDVLFGGVIFNRVSTPSHADWLRQGLLSHPLTAPIRILGRLPTDARIHIPERHLGLHRPQHDAAQSEVAARLAILSHLIQSTIDLKAVRDLAQSHAAAAAAHRLAHTPPAPARPLWESMHAPRIRIGVAQDAAFCFYYADNLRLLEAAGALLVPFSPMLDRDLPPVHALLFGGVRACSRMHSHTSTCACIHTQRERKRARAHVYTRRERERESGRAGGRASERASQRARERKRERERAALRSYARARARAHTHTHTQGYPELYAQALSENTAMRAQVRDFSAKGKLVWAECGGLMYLARSLMVPPDSEVYSVAWM